MQEREITQHHLAEKFIQLCKGSHSEEDFISSVEKEQIAISKNFLASLYNKIRQGLSAAMHLVEGQDEPEEPMKMEPKDEVFEKR